MIGAMRFSRSFSMVSLSSRKSSLVPTSMMGVFGAWWLISGYHFVKNGLSWRKGEDGDSRRRICVFFVVVIVAKKKMMIDGEDGTGEDRN